MADSEPSGKALEVQKVNFLFQNAPDDPLVSLAEIKGYVSAPKPEPPDEPEPKPKVISALPMVPLIRFPFITSLHDR